MNEKQRIELTWIETEHRPRAEPRLQINLAEQPASNDSVSCWCEALLGVCGNPRCGCFNIRLELQSLPESAGVALSGLPRDFWLNLNQKTLVPTPEQKNDPLFRRLEGIISAELTDADQRRLREWFLAEKLELIQLTPVSRIDLEDLPDADDGKMIGFVDVFPCGLALNFAMGTEAWAVDEQYCVQPGCNCSETVLTFLKLVDASGRTTKVIRDAPAIRYNYRTHETKLVAHSAAGGPSPDALLAALVRGQANVDKQLQLRHLIMQALYARHYIERTKSRFQSLSRMQSVSAVRPLKIGRNESCPCGSGRKYKHCCLNKSITPPPQAHGGGDLPG